MREWTVSSSTDGECLWRLLLSHCAKADLAPPAPGDLIERLMLASRHRFGRCIENLVNAIKDALENGDAALDMQHFAESWKMNEGWLPECNVFLVPHWSRLDLDLDPEPPVRRRKRRTAPSH